MLQGRVRPDGTPVVLLTVAGSTWTAIIDTWSFEPGALEAKDVETIVKRLRDKVPLRKQVEVKKG